MAAATLISRILGLCREVVYAHFMGNTWVAGAFLLAYQIPNLFRRLLGEGALTAAFIPVFKEKEQVEGETAMWHTANAVVSGLIVTASLVVALAILVVSGLLWIGDFEAKTRLMFELLRIMLPYMVLVCFAAVCMGMLNARGHFFVPALGAAMLNLVMIASALWWAPRVSGGLPRQIFALAYGVLLAGVAQAVFQMPSLVRNGWHYFWVRPWRDPAVMEVVRRMIPTVLGAAAFQLNIVITQGFAFFVGASIVASFQYAVRLMELPQGLFGVSMATYLLPTLSGLAADRKFDEFRRTLLSGLSHLLVVNVLAAALLVSLARPIVRLLFEGGLFRASATESVSWALLFLGPGLVAYSGTSILARAFYALGDTRIPMQVSVFCLAVNTVLSVGLAMSMHAAGLALANTITSWINVALLAYALRRRLKGMDFGTLAREGALIMGIATAVGLGTWFLMNAWEAMAGTRGLAARTGAVFVPAIAGAAVYFGALWALGVPACRELLGLLRVRRGGRPRS